MLSTRVLMVCLGNICRSPMADGLLRQKVALQKLDIEVDSAGTANYHVGAAPDHRMIKTGAQNGTPIDFLRARQFTQQDFTDFDYILVMDQSNYKNVCALAPEPVSINKVALLLDYLNDAHLQEVPDPYYGTAADFQYVYDLLDRAIDAFLAQL
ncbi:MAG: low molecular weight protein-tyrosine-phosphatase [Flavobacteriales bacterium]